MLQLGTTFDEICCFFRPSFILAGPLRKSALQRFYCSLLLRNGNTRHYEWNMCQIFHTAV